MKTLAEAFPQGIVFNGSTKVKVDLTASQLETISGRETAAHFLKLVNRLAAEVAKTAWCFPEKSVLDKTGHITSSYLLNRPTAVKEIMDELGDLFDRLKAENILMGFVTVDEYDGVIIDVEKYAWETATKARYITF